MAINYAQKYEAEVDGRFAAGSLTAAVVGSVCDWTGVNTVNVCALPTVAMGDYEMSGTGRYGVPDELDATAQALTLTRDRAFTFIIDRRNHESTMMQLEAGKALQRQLEGVVIPEIDGYRIGKLAANAGTAKTGALTSANAYDAFLDGVNALTDGNAPLAGRVALVSPRFYKAIKLDPSFLRGGDIAASVRLSGQVGSLDGVPLILAPGSYFPTGTYFVLAHPSAVAGPVKLCDYKIHDNPPGINGWLVEGRVVYDAFVIRPEYVYAHSEV
jgi:N4-gp56 family major capsid protein